MNRMIAVLAALGLTLPVWAGTQDDPNFWCPAGSVDGYIPDTGFGATSFPSNNTAGRRVYARFFDADQPVTAVRWWGTSFSPPGLTPCNPGVNTYRVGLYLPNGSVPGGGLVEFNATPTITNTGETVGSLPLYLFEVDLPEAVTLPGEGWLSVYVSSTQSNCLFSWSSGGFGFGDALSFENFQYGELGDDPAFCLVTECDATGGTEGEGEGSSGGEGAPESEDAEFRVRLFDLDALVPITDAEVIADNLVRAELDAETGEFVFPCLTRDEHLVVVRPTGFPNENLNIDLADGGDFQTVFYNTDVEEVQEGECGERKTCGDFFTTIVVEVLDADTRRTIDAASVSATPTAGTATCIDGICTFPLVGNGQYSIEASAEGYESASVLVIADFDALEIATVELQPNQVPIFSHTLDENADGVFTLSELLAVIQLYNAPVYHCDETGYVIGPGGDQCCCHASDFLPLGSAPDNRIELSEVLRAIQFYSLGGYIACPDAGTEDGYCAN